MLKLDACATTNKRTYHSVVLEMHTKLRCNQILLKLHNIYRGATIFQYPLGFPATSMTLGITFFKYPIYFLHTSGVSVTQNCRFQFFKVLRLVKVSEVLFQGNRLAFIIPANIITPCTEIPPHMCILTGCLARCFRVRGCNLFRKHILLCCSS